MFTPAERLAASIVAFLAAAIVAAYLLDAIGFALHPFAILAIAAAAAAVGSIGPERSASRTDLLVLAAVMTVEAAWLLWLAWPHLLPIGGGSDLTHHLLLIEYIERTRHLVHDPALGPVLGEMSAYTPGAHLLTVLVASWLRTTALHTLYPVIALSVALKTGFVFLVAGRLTGSGNAKASTGVTAVQAGIVAVLLLFLPRAYFLDSFVHDSFVAQVICELFAMAMWWAIVCWDADPDVRPAALFGLSGAAAFLTWPVWAGPLAATFVLVALLRREVRPRVRAAHAAIGLGPIAVVAVLHASTHLSAASIAGTAGFALRPTPATVGWIFMVLGAAGTLLTFRDRTARTIPILLATIALQAGVLWIVARLRGAETPYLALKMFYLAVYPLAVASALVIVDGPAKAGRYVRAVAIALIVLMAAAAIRATPRPTPVVSDSLYDAGRWAGAHVPAGCVDYLVADDDSAYWLHIVVLGNSRSAKRSLDKDTYEPRKAVVRWILPGGLPYAITDDVDALPKDIRGSVDILARFGSAAVLKRRTGAAACGVSAFPSPDHPITRSPDHWALARLVMTSQL